MDKHSIRQLDIDESLEYLKRLAGFDRSYFPFPWTLAAWEQLASEQGHTVFVAEDELGIPLGFALFQSNLLDKQNHLLKICIHPNFRQRSLGERLLLFALRCFEQASFTNCYLEVATENEAALKFYLKFGFQKLTRKQNFYGAGNDAYAMQLVYE